MENEILMQILNEVKITNQRLSSLESRMDRLEDKVDRLEDKVDNLENKVNNIDERLTSLEKDVTSIRGSVVVIENIYAEKLNILKDGYSMNYELLQNYDPRVSRPERTVEKMSIDIRMLQAAQ